MSRPLIESARHRFSVKFPSAPVYLHADPVRMSQAFSDLLNNSCKYSEPGGRISVTAEVQGSEVVVAVNDAGIGIDADVLPTIFQMFTQSDRSMARSHGGLGIGLTLVRRLVELHKGSVHAFSDGPGRGSKFVVRLPIMVDEPLAPTPGPAARKATPVTGHRILVVDDNKDSAASLAILLELSGNETHTAHDGLEALEVAQTFRPDIVVLDLGLPKLNGYEAARQLRQKPWGKTIMLVALTGWGQDEDRRKSSEAGFDQHLVKPVDHAALQKLLSDYPATRSGRSSVAENPFNEGR